MCARFRTCCLLARKLCSPHSFFLRWYLITCNISRFCCSSIVSLIVECLGQRQQHCTERDSLSPPICRTPPPLMLQLYSAAPFVVGVRCRRLALVWTCAPCIFLHAKLHAYTCPCWLMLWPAATIAFLFWFGSLCCQIFRDINLAAGALRILF